MERAAYCPLTLHPNELVESLPLLLVLFP
jgi:hypothetical protein